MSQKYELFVLLADNRSIRPIIEASSPSEAKKIAQAQYPDAKHITTKKRI